jgi:peptidoglycan/LPS O-acetylase OafA/YrhL
MKLRTVHTASGALLVAAFLLTGQFMDRFHNHLEGMADGPRMLYRTRHIFILLSGLLNLGLGTYLRARRGLRQRVCQWCGSAMIMVASALFIAAFFYEPTLSGLETPLSHWGAYLIVAGVALHILSGVGEERGGRAG